MILTSRSVLPVLARISVEAGDPEAEILKMLPPKLTYRQLLFSGFDRRIGKLPLGRKPFEIRSDWFAWQVGHWDKHVPTIGVNCGSASNDPQADRPERTVKDRTWGLKSSG